MTTTQLDALRDLHETALLPERTRTAREMALTAHELDRTGNRATTREGEVWTWDKRRSLWAR